MNRQLPTRLLLLFFLLLYLLFPTHNSSLDAYYYAASVKYGNDLFLPHHLLYNATCYQLLKFFEAFGWKPDVLQVLKALNAIFATACLWVLGKLLRRLYMSTSEVLGWVLVAGASFGVWRYATENEVYLLPVLLSLGGSYWWVCYWQHRRPKQLLLAGTLASVACLYHQVHVFWWLGLLVGSCCVFRSFRAFLLFGIPALLVPLLYCLVLLLYLQQPLDLQSLLGFVLHDFYAGSAGTSIGLMNFVMTGVSFVRTFVQVHGLMAYLPGKSWWWVLPAVVSVGLLVWAVLREPWLQKRETTVEKAAPSQVHLLILVLHLLFAWFAVGNVEFMVMVPFLLPLVLTTRFSAAFLLKTGTTLIIWNFWYGIFPAWYFQFSTSPYLTEMVQQQPNTLFVLDEAIQVTNEFYYQYGVDDVPNVKRSPTQSAARPGGAEALKEAVELQLKAGKPVLTDCVQKKKVLTRAYVVTEDGDGLFFAKYKIMPADTFSTFYGQHVLHQLQLPSGANASE